MKLIFSTSSPFVRKVWLLGLALGLDERIEKLPSAANALLPDERITRYNPLGKVPTLITDDGLSLFDSKVIAEYLCSLVPGNAVLPNDGKSRWLERRQEALADGILEAAIAARQEIAVRPQPLRWQDWEKAQWAKVESGLSVLQETLIECPATLTLGHIAAVCVLGYLDFRFPQWDWADRYPRLAAHMAPLQQQPWVQQTIPAARKSGDSASVPSSFHQPG